MNVKNSYMLVSLCLFQPMFSPYARFPPERNTLHAQPISVVLVGMPLCVF